MNALTPEFVTARPSVRSLVRACAAQAISIYDGHAPARVAAREWPQDSGAEWLCTRAATSVTDMASAPGLTRTVLPDFVSALVPQSAAARIFREGLQLSFGRDAQISVPTLLGDPSRAAFVREGYPIPVVQSNVEPLVTLSPRKLAAIVVLTAEMVRSSNIEALVLDAMARSVGLALDNALLDDVAGDETRPAGIRYGIAPLTASTAVDPVSALMSDIETLHRAVASVMIAHPLFITGQTRALMMELRSLHGLEPLTVLGSRALTGTQSMIALAPENLVSALGGVPEISAGHESALQMDTVPASGVATRSMWQTDCAAILIRLPIAWGLRSTSGVAWLTTINW